MLHPNINPTALRMAKTPLCFSHSECNRINLGIKQAYYWQTESLIKSKAICVPELLSSGKILEVNFIFLRTHKMVVLIRTTPQ